MNIFISGQKFFGEQVLRLSQRLGHNIAGISAPKGDRLWNVAGDFEINRIPSGHLNAETLPEGVDLIIAAHSHDFLGQKTRLRSKFGAVGYHPSLLPLHRGRDSIKWAIKMGDRITGGSVYWLNNTVDGGPIAAQDWCFIRPSDDAERLWRRELMPMGMKLIAQVLRDIGNDTFIKKEQDESLATWEPSCNPPPLRRPDLLLLNQ